MTTPTKKETRVATTPLTPAAAIDRTAIQARWTRERAGEAERLKVVRAALLAELRARGVEEVEAFYDGYGDSGNVNSVAGRPESAGIGDIETRLMDFVWDVAYGLHPGFETNDGAEGSFTWNVAEDRIDVDHADFYTERNDYSHEDV